MRKIYGIFYVLGILMIAAVLDVIYGRVARFDPILTVPPVSTLFWMQISSTIFVVVLLLLFTWYLLYTQRNFGVTMVCILLSLCVLCLTTLAGVQFVAQLGVSRNSILRIWLIDIVFSDLSLTSYSSAFILCISVICTSPFRKYLPNSTVLPHHTKNIVP